MIQQFADLGDYYPGSRERRQTVTAPSASGVPEDVLGPGKIWVLRGRDVEMYTIGQVARAIGRKPATLRKWESDGVLPPSGYANPSDDPRGRYRLFTRLQAEGIVRIIVELGMMDPASGLPLKPLQDRLWGLFNDLKGRQ